MNANDSASFSETTPGLLLALRGWSRGCAALARREFARSLGRKRLSPADLAGFAGACASARRSVSAVTCVAALMLAAKPVAARADLLRGNVKASPGNSTAAQDAARLAAQQKQAAQVLNAKLALARATQSVKALQAAQLAARSAARSAAQLNAGNITNGLGAGGLNVAAGVGTDSSLWLNAQGPVQTVSGDRTQVTIVQTDSKAILTWDEFNVGANTDLYFNQKAGGSDASQWIALNRVVGASTAPSTILGSIKAEGQVYVINQNGVLFGGASQVNVHSLVASGLDFRGVTVADRNAAFQQGLAFDDIRANYTLGVDAGSGRPVGDVTVEAGATITSDGSGAVYLFGKNVANAGTLTAPDGQVLLAAGDRIWITKNLLGFSHSQSNLDLRGVTATVQDGGTVTNTGLIETARGNITLSGKSLDVGGALHATTSSKANGSITLIAGDATAPHDYWWMWPTAFGDITLRADSLLSVTPDDSAGTAFSTQYRASRVDIYGRTIVINAGASIYAPAANVTMVAKTHATDATAANDPSRIYIDSGASIFLAGLPEVEVAMERNTVTGNLRLDELKDSPLQKDGPLRGAKVSVDLRRGTTLADMSGYYALIEYGVEELMTAGGTLKLDSGSVITRAGSVIDLSGGSVKYLDGYVTTTRLRGTDGRIYDIATARPDIAYSGVYDTYQKFETGYLEGKAAGTLVIGPQAAPYPSFPEAINPTGDGNRPYFMAVEGDILASTVTGRYQRLRPVENATPQLAWTLLPEAASLVIGYSENDVYYGPNVRIGNATPLPAGFGANSSFDLADAHDLTLPARLFDGNTFGTVKITGGVGGGTFAVDAGVTMNLGAFGSLDFHGSQALIDGSIVAPGGSVSILADIAKGWNQSDVSSPAWTGLAEADRPRVALGSGAKIDVSGLWVNELAAGSDYGALATGGGSVSLRSVYDLTLAAGSVVDVSGGGRLTAAGRLTGGDAGSILLENDLLPFLGVGGGAPARPAGSFDVLSADLRGYALGKGGSLSLGASRAVVISSAPGVTTGTGAADTLWLAPEFFSQGGFASYDVAGSRSVTVDTGTVVQPHVVKYVASRKLWSLASGGDIRSAVTTGIVDPRGGYLPVDPSAYADYAGWVDSLVSGKAGYSAYDLREAMSLTLSVGLRGDGGRLLAETLRPGAINTMAGTLTVKTGAAILLDPGSSIALYSLGDMTVDGILSAPGGSISLGLTDPGPSTLRLGANAQLLARGYVGATFDANGVAVRTVRSGGSVDIDVVHALGTNSRIETDLNSLIDVSGVSGSEDLLKNSRGLLGGNSGYTTVRADGNAGSVGFSGFRTGFVAGRIQAAPAGATAAGGSVSISAGDLVNSLRTSLFLTDRLTDRLTSAELFPRVDVNGTGVPAAGDTITVYLPALRASGADDLAFLSSTKIAFDGDVSLTTRRSLSFSSPVLGIAANAPAGSRVDLTSTYVSFAGFPGVGESDIARVGGEPTPPPTLTGLLTVRGNLIDIKQTLDLGGAGLGGFDTAKFVSSGDIRLTVGETTNDRVGRLQSAGALVLESAQTYVTTASRARTEADTGFLIKSGRSVTFTGNGGATPVPYSYGEKLTVAAPLITQAGVLRAPLGTIDLRASVQLTLAPGSLTSVSAEGLVIPIGSVTGGLVTPFPTRDNTLAEVLANNTDKKVSLSGPAVTVAAGATVDVSGGGDLSAYEFIAGNGGSADILNRPGMFAVLPGYVSPAAPVYNKADLAAGSLKAGDSVYLSGVAGLADGVYTLLPSHFALLKGGVAIQAMGSGFAPISGTTTLPDGSQIVGGYRTVAGTTIRDTATTRFLAISGETIRKYSAYNEYGYDKYVTDATTKAGLVTPRLPGDAGTLAINATASLTLDGRGRFGAADGGLLGNLDIAALKIAIVGDTQAAPTGYLSLNAGSLAEFGVGSLLLGGTRTQTTAGTQVNIGATDVLVMNDAASALVIPEIILAATGKVTVADGSVIRAAGATSNTTSPLLLSGDGALLRASTGSRVDIVRTGSDTASGDLSLGANVTISATSSIALDGTRSVENRTTTVLSAPQLSLSSAQVSLGDAPSGTAGLVLAGTTLAMLGEAKDLLIRSYGSIDLYGAASLGETGADGRPVLDRLTFEASAINGIENDGQTASLVAKNIGLKNSAGVTASTATTGTGALELKAETLSIGPGALATRGFATTSVAADRVTGTGSGTWNVAGDLAIATDLVTAGKGSETAIVATGTVSVTQGRGTTPATPESGGKMSLSGTSVELDTRVDLPSGIFEVNATSGDVTLGDHARVSSKGVATVFYDVTKISSGGTVRLAATGNVTMASGAVIDVSGNTLGGAAGSIEVNAASGAATLDGTLTGKAYAGGAGGSLSVDAGSLPDFSSLNSRLNSGGFDATREIRVRTGALTLAAGESIVAHDVSLRADTGKITVSGSVLATGTTANVDGGTVSLRAGDGVSLEGTAVIDVSTAFATSSAGFSSQSGKIEITADAGDVGVAAGSVLRATGGARNGGSVVVTAQRNGADIRVSQLAGTVTAREFILRGRADYVSAGTVNTANYAAMLGEAGTWMSGAGAIVTRLGASGVEIQPGIRVTATGDLTLANDLNLVSYRYAGVPGAIDFVAGGDLKVNGSISDGFSTATAAGVLQTGRSWSLGFESGRDLTLAADKLIRTGTGDIRITAGRDLTLTTTKSVIYTAGSKTADTPGFVATGRTGEYPVNGGDIVITAGRDIRAPLTQDFVTGWLFRYGYANTAGGVSQSQMTVDSPTSWSVVFANFEQGVGALGGGNVRVDAGRDIHDLAVVLPTTGQSTAQTGQSVGAGTLVVRGGGNLKMTAGNDIYGGLTMMGKGEAVIVAGGDITSDLQSLQRNNANISGTTPTTTGAANTDAAANFTLRDLHALFALSDATLSLSARGDVQIEAIVDPMMIPVIATNRSGTANYVTFFSSYTNRTEADVTAVAGDITYFDNPWAGADLARANNARQIHQRMTVPNSLSTDDSVISNDLLYVPGTMSLVATQGSVVLEKRFESLFNQAFRLAPSSDGNLEILAAEGISAALPVIMMDIAPEYVRDARAPFRTTARGAAAALVLADSDLPGPATNYGRGTTPLHGSDTTPVRLYATDGNISGADEIDNRLFLYLPKSAEIKAGGDIADLTLQVQHNRNDAVSVVEAGRDILRPILRVLGAGNLIVEAGRDIDLTSTAAATSIVSTGNVGGLVTTTTLFDNLTEIYPNLALRNAGASITLMAGGASADYAGFADLYLNPARSGDVVRNYLPELRNFMTARGVSGDDASLLTAFAALAPEIRQPFLLDVYFSELKETGIDATAATGPRHGSYERGFDAIKALFGTTTPANAGNIRLFGKSVASRQGGDIRILAPHGDIGIDVITNPAASSQGVVTQKGGAVRMMSEGDIALANSRVFSLQGGDILMWTSKGDITAGAGSSTRAVPPALVYTVDSDANVLLNAGSLQTGAGIGVLDANRSGLVTSRLDLVAPAGTVDAGDAGIRSAGAINIAAQTILGAANITAGGAVTGVAAAPSVNVAAVSAANNTSAATTSGATEEAQKQRTAAARQEIPASIFSVEVLGYGGEDEERPKNRVSDARPVRNDNA